VASLTICTTSSASESSGKKLSSDYRTACRERSRLAHESAERIASARKGLQRLRQNGFHVWDGHEVTNEVAPDVAQPF
jgi:hypothetical protein